MFASSIKLIVANVLFLLLPYQLTVAQGPINLIDTSKELGGWSFDNGKEFPGAEGKLLLIQEKSLPTLELYGDFSKGGNYVQAAKALPNVSTESISFEVKVPSGVNSLTMRLVDGTDQCHQLSIRLNDKGGWQNYSFPIARYFASVESGSPLDIVSKYEKWGGSNDGRWHQGAKLFVIIAGKEVLRDGSIAIKNVQLASTPAKTEVETTVSLTALSKTDLNGWSLNNGNEFPGAKGEVTIQEVPDTDGKSILLKGNFQSGGRYVGMKNLLTGIVAKTTKAIRMRIRTNNARQFSLRLVDENGQTHQRGKLPLRHDGHWQDITFYPEKIAGGEHWGGPNDGKWKGSVRLIEIMLSLDSSDDNTPSIEIADITTDIVVEAEPITVTSNIAFQNNDSWKFHGDVSWGQENTTQTRKLKLSRSLENASLLTQAISPLFEVNQGTWKVDYEWMANLHSPDNSYQGKVSIETFDKSGNQLDSYPIAIGFGKKDWSTVSKTINLPLNVSTAQWRIELQKTYGEFQLQNASMTRLRLQPPETIIDSIRISTNAPGNLFFPSDVTQSNHVQFQLAVFAKKGLPASSQIAQISVRDYRNRELLSPQPVKLSQAVGKQHQYEATIAIAYEELLVGKFYELHVTVPQHGDDFYEEFSGFAVLPKANTKDYAPEESPFTIRNWDGRIPEYFTLADRLGLRTIGLWGEWPSSTRTSSRLPGIEQIEKLNAKWITTTPAATIEREGFKNISEKELQEGTRDFLNTFAKRGLAKIALGNEPHGTGKKVADNVRAYQIVYETVKEHDKNIEVIGTSVEPNEEYFQAGYQNYLDSYDFHIYEEYQEVRNTMAAYRALMKKYNAVKPIHSTELGSNSQGQARINVAIELIKKCTVFFAEGGKTVSWFTIQYPDPKGQARGQSGDSHCVFDCKFNNYNPRIDAIAYYAMINSIGSKRFVSEQQSKEGMQMFRFQDNANRHLIVAWNDLTKQIANIAVPKNAMIEIIHVDGERERRESGNGIIEVEISNEPVLILYSMK